MSAERFEDRVVISGIGMSAIGRRLMRDPLGLIADAAKAAIADAGLTRDDIDGISTYPGSWSPGHSGGGSFEELHQFLAKTGVTDESCAPYQALDFAYRCCHSFMHAFILPAGLASTCCLLFTRVWGRSQAPCEESMCRQCDRFGVTYALYTQAGTLSCIVARRFTPFFPPLLRTATTTRTLPSTKSR